MSEGRRHATAKELREAGQTAIAVTLDVGRKPDIDAAVSAEHRAFRLFDVLITAAATVAPAMLKEPISRLGCGVRRQCSRCTEIGAGLPAPPQKKSVARDRACRIACGRCRLRAVGLLRARARRR